MADFRRCILAFAVVTMLLGLIPTASAQTAAFQCVANAAVPPTVRAEGLTELVGDIVLNCTGGTPTPAGSQLPQANITVFLNTQVTSRLYSSNQSEAILTIDEPLAPAETSARQTCTSISGCAAFAIGPVNNNLEFKTTFSPGGAAGCAVDTPGCFLNPNVFQGTVSGNSVTFVGVPIDPPGSTFTRIYRITNVRANASIPAPGGAGTPGQIIALISATPATSPLGLTSTFPINNPTQIVGFVQNSLSTSVTAVASSTALTASSIAIQQCVGIGVAGGRNALVGQLNFTELFPTAFKTRFAANLQNQLGLVYNAESGYINPLLASPLGNGTVTPANNLSGVADYGTRLKAVFNNIPNGVSILVSINNVASQVPIGGTITAQTGTFAALTSSATGVGFTPVTSTTTTAGSGSGASSGAGTIGGLFQIPIVNGTGTAVWEVLAANPLTNQTYSFNFYAVATPSPATNSPAPSSSPGGTVKLSYAPVPPADFTAASGAAASSSLPIPRFIDTSTDRAVVSVILCRTNLLFPYVANTAGFDTGLAISNTSTDPFGTPAQQGPCRLNFFGTNAPAAVASPSVASGTTYTALASSIAPNFLGYVIAVCDFQYAHGFAFVSDVGARNLAMGYLALVIPDPPRSATPFDCSALSFGVAGTGITSSFGCAATGEQLGF